MYKKCAGAAKGQYYYTSSAYNTIACSKKDCTNVGKPGTKYKEGWAVSADSCPIEDCDTLKVGMKFAKFNSCESVRCTNARAGEYYTSNGGENGLCDTKPCDAKPGFGYDR